MSREEQAIQKNVFEAIESGRVKMRSKWYFALQTILAVVGGVILGLFLIYIIGFFLFLLRQSGLLYAPGMGVSGWYIFFRSLPWLLIVLSLIFLLVLVILVNHFAFSYQRPLLYSLLGILIVLTAASFVVAVTPVGSYLPDYNNPPILSGYYSSYDAGDISDVHRGEIITMASNGFILEGLSGETSTVLLSSGLATDTILNVKTGDLVVVFGVRDPNGYIEASAIDKIGP